MRLSNIPAIISHNHWKSIHMVLVSIKVLSRGSWQDAPFFYARFSEIWFISVGENMCLRRTWWVLIIDMNERMLILNSWWGRTRGRLFLLSFSVFHSGMMYIIRLTLSINSVATEARTHQISLVSITYIYCKTLILRLSNKRKSWMCVMEKLPYTSDMEVSMDPSLKYDIRTYIPVIWK